VSDVGLSLPSIGIDGPQGIMLSEGATADHVRAALTGDYPAKPFVLDPGAHLSHADIDAGRRAAVIVSDIAGAGPATITDSYVRGGPALLGFHTGQTALLQRDKLVATGDQDAVLTFGGTTIVEDSVIDLHVRLRRVPPGRYLLRATVVDAAGNRGIARATKARVA